METGNSLGSSRDRALSKMSSSLGVHIWLGSRPESATALFATFASCIERTTLDEPGFGVHPRFRRVIVEKTSVHNVVADTRLQSNSTDDLLTVLQRFDGPNYMFRVDSAVQLKEFDPQKQAVRETICPMKLRFHGANYGHEGFNRRREGDLTVTLTYRDFLIPLAVIEAAERASAKSDRTWMTMATELSRNIEIVHDLAIRLIKALAPELVVVCTNSEVHPLTSHALYHAQIQDFIDDIHWIRKLHFEGGFYRQEITENDSLYQEPRAITQDYGFLRQAKGSNKNLIAWIESLSHTPRLETSSILEEAIKNVLELASNTTTVGIDNSVYLQNNNGAFGYLEEPFQDLSHLI